MNKDVIYLEPEDDITNIISKIQDAKQKVIALVPPKKITVLRSAVNLKLITKTAAELEKVVVIITKDVSLQKLALSANIPVAESLQSRPILPTDTTAVAKITAAAESVDSKPASKTPKSSSDATSDDDPLANFSMSTAKDRTPRPAEELLDDSDIEADEVDDIVTNTPKKSPKVSNFLKYRKFIIAGAIVLTLILGFGVWASTLAQSAKIAVSVRTTANNFSEPVNFTIKPNEEDAKSGVFFLEQQKLVKVSEVKFKATGQKNIGEKAKGNIVVSANFTPAQVANEQGITIAAGTKFTYDSKEYVSTSATVISANKSDVASSCENGASFFNPTCAKSAKVPVQSVESGEKFNLGEHSSGWTSNDRHFTIKGNESISGGTDKIVTVIQQSDINKAKELLATASESDGRAELTKKIPSGALVLDTTFKMDAAKAPTSIPALNEEVKDDQEPVLKSETTFTMYSIDKVRIEEFIRAKSETKIADDQKVYSVGSPFVERFMIDETKKFYATAKIKTTTDTGPKITEQDIMDKSRGRKIGEVQSLIKSINGVSTVSVEVPYFWVRSVPDDPNKVTIDLSVEK